MSVSYEVPALAVLIVFLLSLTTGFKLILEIIYFVFVLVEDAIINDCILIILIVFMVGNLVFDFIDNFGMLRLLSLV